MVTHPYYGCFGEVIDTQTVHKSKRIKGKSITIL